MSKFVFAAAFAAGLAAVLWTAASFVGTSAVALVMTLLIGAVFGLGAWEVWRFRAATAGLTDALDRIPQPLAELGGWLGAVPAALQNAVRARVEGERVGLPGLSLTPYLVGLLVMLGMLGTFLGMVVTFKGAVSTLDGSADLTAIRAALGAPIKGLALAFGTSVAGVASSAMLGLMSALSRRERAVAVRLLDTRIATVLRPFSLVHQRQESLRAVQAQAQVLPAVVDRLQQLMEQIERRSQQVDAQLLDRQADFHREAGAAYSGLAQSVERSLSDALGASARVAGERMQPVVESAMAAIAQESTRLHERVGHTVQLQLDGLGQRFASTTQAVADTWQAALAQHAGTSERQVSGLEQALAGFTQTFDQRSQHLLVSVREAAASAQAEQQQAERQRQDAWTQSLTSVATTLQTEWQQAGAQSLARQQAVCEALEHTASAVAERTREHAGRTLGEVSRLLGQSEDLVRARTEAEARWTQEQAARMDQLAALWRSELCALREQEAQRGGAAVERLGQLQATLADHMATLRQEETARGQAAVARLGELQAALGGQLATLGQALEAPMTRLLESAAEAPRAAAEVIAQLRGQMSGLAERDNQALHERTALVGELDALLRTVQQATGEQRAAIESLVDSASGVLEQAAQQFQQALGAQAGQVQDVAAHVSASAVELASLGESFGHGVQLFSATSEQLVSSLQRIDGALQQSMARSDDQLGYYVAQAREVVDLSISAQQGIVEDLRRLHGQQAARLAGAV